MKLITRNEAVTLRITQYYTGRPCVNGHLSPRNTSSGNCLQCWREKNKEGYYLKKHNIKSPANNKTEKFIEKAIKVHGNKYDYSSVVYLNNSHKIKIICPEHDMFEQSPKVHLRGIGCKLCNLDSKVKSWEDFVATASRIHNNKFEYPKCRDNWKGLYASQVICCPIHGDFDQVPYMHLRGHGCKKCFTDVNKYKQDFILKASIIHNSKYDYSNIDYINSQTKISILCPTHGNFLQVPRNHLNGQGCNQCANDKSKNTLQVCLDRFKKAHNDVYDYSLVTEEQLVRTKGQKLRIICPTHGEFYQLIGDHLHGHGCPSCAPVAFSKKSLSWLDHIQETEGLIIQHAGNDGEFRIPDTQLSADGYCVETNTVYEFDGDAFHGNPNRYNPTDNCHPFNKEFTAGELYSNTLIKHAKIRELGYNLVTIWESDFDKMGIPLRQYEEITISKKDETYPEKLRGIGLEIVGEYQGSKLHHNLKCLKCGNIHTATPISKLWCSKRHPDNYGCPDCNKQLTDNKNKQRGNYEERLLALNYKVFDYKNAGIKAHMVCIICGNEKYVTPSAIIQRNKPCCGEGDGC